MKISRLFKHQRGAALFVSLLLLVVMTLIALAAGQSTRMQEKMSGNIRDADLAFQAAEAALRDGDQQVVSLKAEPTLCADASATCDYYDHDVLPADLSAQPWSWWSKYSRQYLAPSAGTTGANNIPNVDQDPRTIVEEVANLPPGLSIGKVPTPGRVFYRVVAHGTGGTSAAEAVIDTTYSRPSF